MTEAEIGLFLKSFLKTNVEALEATGSAEILGSIEKTGHHLSNVLLQGGLIVSAGNGGSMADAMHLAEELSGKYRNPRPGLRAVALSDPTYLTCVGNDFGYENVFSRGCEALMRKGDVAILYSTSGSSPNTLVAAESVKRLGGTVVAITGKPNSDLQLLADFTICPATHVRTEVAQLIHTMWTHMLIEIVEKNLGYN
jgi:D-sedoheptulose 7-phosphate isomerase